LKLAEELRQSEEEFEKYRSIVEGAQEAIRRWTKVERTCAEQRLNDSRVFAQGKKAEALQIVNWNQSSLDRFRSKVAGIRPILMQLQEEEEVDIHI
jgi:hypothetical protein